MKSNHEERGSTLLRNDGTHIQIYIATYSTRRESITSTLVTYSNWHCTLHYNPSGYVKVDFVHIIKAFRKSRGIAPSSAEMNVKFTTREIFSWLMATYLILQTLRFAVNSDGNENCVLLGYYAEISGNTLSKIRDNLSVENYHYSLRNNPEVRGSRLPLGGRLKSAENLGYFVGRKLKFNTGILIQKKNLVFGVTRP